ncbi:MAG: hypothetical protein J6T27_00285 [Alphaproteobacteria bacterium]|nr:hypothetical protein [Alphaproteobacteria bacterium]
MSSERGSFLIQALLALTLIFVFMPFLAHRLAVRDMSAQMYSATRQVDTIRTAAKIYIEENASDLPFNETKISGEKLTDLLEPYGLPIGFVTRTALGQDISLIVNKDEQEVSAFIRLTGGKINTMQRAELARRIGFYAVFNPEQDNKNIDVGIHLGEVFSDVVRRNDGNSPSSAFLADLDMGENNLNNVANIFARRAKFDTGEVVTLSITGTEAGRKERSSIKMLNTNKTVFQSVAGEAALSLTRGSLKVGSMIARTVSKFGDTGNMTVGDADIVSFDMSAGRTSFTGPTKWSVGGNLVTSRITFNVERLDVGSFVNVSRGQDVFIDANTLTYSSASGMDANSIRTGYITLKEQTSSSLARQGDGATLLDIRPSGTSILPDALVDTIDNGAFEILANPTQEDDATVNCSSIISSIGSSYNAKSLAQYIICQYVFWQRLEQRIDIKQCLIRGGSDCN